MVRGGRKVFDSGDSGFCSGNGFSRNGLGDLTGMRFLTFSGS